MTQQSMALLQQLRNTKAKLKDLENEYRKVCECNERIPGTEHPQVNSYTRTHKVCDYHNIRLMHKQENISYA